jgi:hypothetical protein
VTQYLSYFLFYLAVALAAMACIGYLLDPFGYFRSHGLRTNFFLGDRVWGDDRIAKDMALAAVQPQTLIAGSSRVQRGMNVDDPRARHYLGRAYNLGIEAATIDELDFHIRSVLTGRSLRTLIVGFDLGELIISNNHYYIPHNYDKYLPLPLLSGLHGLRKLRMALWSKEAVKAAEQVLTSPNNLTLNGLSNPTVIRSVINQLGHRELSRRTEIGIARYFQSEKGWDAYQGRIESLGRLIEEACSQKVESKLFVSPVHVRQLLLLKAVGRWEHFLQWKLDLTSVADRARQGGCKVSLIDFSRVSAITEESFPERGDTRSSMKWYWDSSHYNTELGLLVLQRLFGDENLSMRFGNELTNDNIHREIEEARTELERYIDVHPELLREQQELLRQYSGM